jgi:hypothetical protein
MRKKLVLGGLCAVLLVAVLFTVVFWSVPQFVNPSAPAYLQDESLAFVRDVVGFNLSEYRVVDSHFWPQLDVATRSGFPLYLMRYDLESPDDKAWVDVYYIKVNDTYIQEPYFDMISENLFSPAYPSDKVLTWTKNFIERYQNINNATYIADISKILDTVDQIQPMNVTSGNIKLQITIRQFTEQDIYTTIRFAPINSTAHDFDNAVTFEFHNGRTLNFYDRYEST